MKFAKDAFTVGVMTMLSRILGFVRDMLFAAVLGTGPIAGAFIVAFRIPNLFRRIFAEGAFNAAFVPLYNKKIERDGEAAATKFASEAMSGLVLILLILTALFEIFMPTFLGGIAWGFRADADKYDLAVELARIMFPYLMFLSIMALIAGILNSFQKFAIAALVPVLLNVVVVSAIIILVLLNVIEQELVARYLSYAVTFAGFVQVAAIWYYCKKQGHLPHFMRPTFNKDIKELVNLGVPGMIAGGITQINIVIGTGIATSYTGAVGYLYYADRLYQLPLGVVGVAVGVVLLPSLSRAFAAHDKTEANDLQNRALEFSMMLTVPAMVAFLFIAEVVVSVLFERGRFNAPATVETAIVLRAFAVGLPAFVAIKVFSPGFFANQDTKTPMYYGIATIIANTVMALIFAQYWQHVGIAIATSIAAWMNCLLLAGTLYWRGHFKLDVKCIKTLPMIVIASLLMGACVYYSAVYLSPWLSADNNDILRGGLMSLLVIEGAVTYGLFLHYTGALTFSEMKGFVKRKNKNSKPLEKAKNSSDNSSTDKKS
ncbi:MAG: murein biosynthesis integral membrane protein MurJ [Hyphomicrobiales bacterium]|nr:MAG: murein biosynthesis integral membrane protein MurJ [Hyphomicrobiales bacterium]